jgi:hypothetical protein
MPHLPAQPQQVLPAPQLLLQQLQQRLPTCRGWVLSQLQERGVMLQQLSLLLSQPLQQRLRLILLRLTMQLSSVNWAVGRSSLLHPLVQMRSRQMPLWVQ